MRNAKSIIDNFMQRVMKKEIIPTDEWMKAAQFLNVLIGEEQNTLAQAEQEYVKVSLGYISQGDTNAVAEKKAKISSQFIDFKKQQAFVKQIEEFIRLSKKQATITHEQGA